MICLFSCHQHTKEFKITIERQLVHEQDHKTDAVVSLCSKLASSVASL